MKRIWRLLLIAIYFFPSLSVSAQTLEPRIADAVGMEQITPSGSPTLDLTGCTRVDVAAVNAAYEHEVVELVNQKRWDNGQLPPLKRNSLLDLASRYHAKDED